MNLGRTGLPLLAAAAVFASALVHCSQASSHPAPLGDCVGEGCPPESLLRRGAIAASTDGSAAADGAGSNPGPGLDAAGAYDAAQDTGAIDTGATGDGSLGDSGADG